MKSSISTGRANQQRARDAGLLPFSKRRGKGEVPLLGNSEETKKGRKTKTKTNAHSFGGGGPSF